VTCDRSVVSSGYSGFLICSNPITRKYLRSSFNYWCLMVFNTTSNNISAISWWSVLLVEEPGVPGENYRLVGSQWQTTRVRRGRDRIVVGFTTTYAISAYHHWCCEFESRSGRGAQRYVIECRLVKKKTYFHISVFFTFSHQLPCSLTFTFSSLVFW
jgi:hypothetical protein